MTVFIATLNQTAFLFAFIVIGYVLARLKVVPDNASTVLSKLENNLFIPALVLGTFIGNFTVETIGMAWKLMLGSLAAQLVIIGLALVCVRICTKDPYKRDLYTYGLSFANFGFMGNAVVSALFPEIFLEYLIFTLPMWTAIYLWGVPFVLMGDAGEKPTMAQRLKNFANPMFVCTVLGMVIGLIGVPIPKFLRDAVSTAGSCMSPVAMLLTGMILAQFDFKEILRIKSVYTVTAMRLLLFPLLAIGVMLVIPMPKAFATCLLCAVTMPLGMNTIIIPSALGKDTRVGAGMTLVSHVLGCLTIPVIFMLFQTIIK